MKITFINNFSKINTIRRPHKSDFKILWEHIYGNILFFYICCVFFFLSKYWKNLLKLKKRISFFSIECEY